LVDATSLARLWDRLLLRKRLLIELIRGEDDSDIFLEDGSLALRCIGKGKQSSVGVFGEVSVFPPPKFEIWAVCTVIVSQA
jgi:hypothetical protein